MHVVSGAGKRPLFGRRWDQSGSEPLFQHPRQHVGQRQHEGEAHAEEDQAVDDLAWHGRALIAYRSLYNPGHQRLRNRVLANLA